MRKSLKYLVAVGLWLCIYHPSLYAQSYIVISDDVGGRIGTYVEAFSAVRASGQKVVIDGVCLSACTLVLGIIPRHRICARPHSRLGFHAAWHPGPDGRPVTSEAGTQALWDVYPAYLRKWILSQGGLSRKMIYAHGKTLREVVAICKDTP